jgi:ankyrin repeat protein
MWLDEDEEVVRRVTADPRAGDAGCGGVLAAACKQGKADLLVRLLAAGVRVPPALTECRSYLVSDPAMLRLLLASGMNPDLPNWLLSTPLHDLCGRDDRGRIDSSVPPSCLMLARTSPRGMKTTGRRRSRGRLARDCWIWWSSC